MQRDRSDIETAVSQELTDQIASPRGLRNQLLLQSKITRLSEPHVAPLTSYIDQLRSAHPEIEFPYFDPDDGGIDAQILFLFEKPGPMSATTIGQRKGSGFISRDNDDPTAQNTFQLMSRASIPRRSTSTWNIIPGWNGSIKISLQERSFGLRELDKLTLLFQNLKVIVLVGKEAQRASSTLESRFKVFKSPHPSNRVKNLNRSSWDKIPEIWMNAYLSSCTS